VRVLAACSLGGAGHLNPLLPFLDAARRRGDETLVMAPPTMREMVERAGHPFAPGEEPPEEVVAPIREQLPIAPRVEASILGNRDLFGRLATTAMLPPMERIVAEWAPDLIVRDPCEYASAVVAGRLGVPMVQVGISLAEVESGAIGVAAPALEDHRAGLTDEVRRSPYLTRFPAALDPSTFPTTVRFREPNVGAAGDPLPDWWDGSRAPLVYVSFGTVLAHMTFAADVYRVALRAVDDLHARVLLTVGTKFDASELGAVARHVHVESWIDQAQVFGDAALVVCHGGSGTVYGALAAGVPVVVVPVFADQFANGRRVARAGAGLVVEPEAGADDGPRTVISVDDAPRVTDAIEAALANPTYRETARGIAAEMASTPDVDAVLDSLLAG
jgi:UDP:flavonoid glycosyltransferase YjiC (YdhE family)